MEYLLFSVSNIASRSTSGEQVICQGHMSMNKTVVHIDRLPVQQRIGSGSITPRLWHEKDGSIRTKAWHGSSMAFEQRNQSGPKEYR